MSAKVRIGGVWKPITALRIFSGGAWRHILAVRIRSGAAWRLITFPTSGDDMAVVITPSPFAFDDAHGGTVIGTLTATPTGGVSPFSYSWSVVSSSGDGTVSVGTGSASVTVTAELPGHGDAATATIRCATTDTLGNTASADASGTLSRP